MYVAKTIPAEHRDLIHDVAYDFHGRRMATCSSDQFVKVGANPSSQARVLFGALHSASGICPTPRVETIGTDVISRKIPARGDGINTPLHVCTAYPDGYRSKRRQI